jgi:hypothetical protein
MTGIQYGVWPDKTACRGHWMCENDCHEAGHGVSCTGHLKWRTLPMNDLPNMRILSDEEFLLMVADQGNPEEINRAFLELRREGRIQFFDDGNGDPLIVKVEYMN